MWILLTPAVPEQQKMLLSQRPSISLWAPRLFVSVSSETNRHLSGSQTTKKSLKWRPFVLAASLFKGQKCHYLQITLSRTDLHFVRPTHAGKCQCSASWTSKDKVEPNPLSTYLKSRALHEADHLQQCVCGDQTRSPRGDSFLDKKSSAVTVPVFSGAALGSYDFNPSDLLQLAATDNCYWCLPCC